MLNGRALKWVCWSAWFVVVAFVGCSGDGAVSTGGEAGAGGGVGGGLEGGAGGGDELNCVVDGVVGEKEECDDGNDISGDGCENDCTWTCTQGTVNGDAACDDTDLCNGVETCTEEHTCDPGTAAADGTSCGDMLICKGGVCSDDVCGDQFVSDGEDCDDGNVTDGDGCDDCSFSCESSDPSACTPADPCEGQGVCDDADHTCGPGTPLSDDTPCGTDAYCKSGVCVTADCPNGVQDFGEDCDDGDVIDGNGCDNDCTFSCVNPTTDCVAAPQCEQQTCNASHVCELAPDPSQDGDTCGSNLECDNGACIAPQAVCGNSILESGEDCDFGTANNGPNTGCESNCKFSCTTNPDSCPDAETCDGAETCGQVMVGGFTGQACSAGTPLADCTACTGGLCNGGSCQQSTCGDGCVDATAMEECEPPNTPTCSATCKDIVCGNGSREGTEQCDDSNTLNNDGCDASCMFEQVDRINWLQMEWNTDTNCSTNALGGAISGGTAQGQLQDGLDSGVADGSITVITKMLGLDDLTGTSDGAVQLGVVSGAPETALATYDGTADLDWWYYVDTNHVDASGVPNNQIPGSIAAKLLTAGPGSLALGIVIDGTPANLSMSDVLLSVLLGATSTPTVSAGLPPGHVASENLDPALVSYASGGQKNSNGAGYLCGKVSAESLAQIAIPQALAGSGLLNCSQSYTLSNSLLDVLVGGCTIFFTSQISSTQPDTHDPDVPDVGAGPNYTLSANSQKVVDGCTDTNGQSVSLTDCLKDAAYSSYFKFATGRVMLK